MQEMRITRIWNLRSDTACDTINMEEDTVAKVKYTLLLPLNFNDGSEVPAVLFDEILNEIMDIADGYSLAGTVTGAYRMKDGSKKMDHSSVVWIGIDATKEDQLKRLVGIFARRLQQEALYLERTGGTIEFIPPLPLEDQT